MGDKKKKGGAMARRKAEIQLQQEIETQEEWEDMLSKEGLCVVDVYQPWCGLCHGMTSNFRKYRLELKDDLLMFFAAKTDAIDALEKYRGRCEPCFLFYGGGVLVAVVRGANAPLIIRTITEQLAQEHKVIDGKGERKEIKDPMIALYEAKEKQSQEEEDEKEEEGEPKPKPKPSSGKGGARKMRFHGELVDFGDDLAPSEAKKEVSVVIIKPDAISNGKKDDIIEEMKSRGIEILREEDRHLTEDEVKNLYTHLQDEEYFDELVKFMSASPCCVLAITKGRTGENIIKEFRELIGPTEVEDAKTAAPQSLRAKYGSDKYMNAVHGSDSSDTAARELAFFFPDFAAPPQDGKPKVQRTLALVRPDAYKAHKEEIIGKIREAGFKIAMQKEVHLNKEQAEEFYSEHRGQEYFEELTSRMSSGPLLALGLAREDAISGWRQMLGPTQVQEAKEQAPDCLRAQYSVDDVAINQLHGSDSEEQAQKEIEYFFPMEQTVAVIKPDAFGTKDEIIEKIHESGFRIAARKETTLSREIAEEFYADHKDKDYYNDLVTHMSSGPTYFMVLSRESAVDGWRSLIGPTDPEQARQSDPESIRGKLGQNILQNAVHGSSTTEHAQQAIQKIFEQEEEAIAEQQHGTFEPAPEYGGQRVTDDEQTTDQTQGQADDIEVDSVYEEDFEEEGSTDEKPSGQTQETDQHPTEEPPKEDEQQQQQQQQQQQEEGQKPEEESRQATPTPDQGEAEQQAEEQAQAQTQDEPPKEEQTPTEPQAEDKPAEGQQAAEGDQTADDQKPAESQGQQQTQDTQEETAGDAKPDEAQAQQQEDQKPASPKPASPKPEESKPEEQQQDDQKAEEPKQEDQQQEEPKQEDSKPEGQQQEDQKAEEPKAEDEKKEEQVPAEQGEAKPDDEKKPDTEQTAGS